MYLNMFTGFTKTYLFSDSFFQFHFLQTMRYEHKTQTKYKGPVGCPFCATTFFVCLTILRSFAFTKQNIQNQIDGLIIILVML